MNTDGGERAYEQARRKLFDLVLDRNKLLLRLNGLTTIPLELQPSSGMIGGFDTKQAGNILVEVEELARQIDEALAEVNELAVSCGKPFIGWYATPPGSAEQEQA